MAVSSEISPFKCIINSLAPIALLAAIFFSHVGRFCLASWIAPCSIMRLKRSFICWLRICLSGLITSALQLSFSKIGGPIFSCHSNNGFPVAFATSQALVTRMGFLMSILLNVALSKSAKRAWIPSDESLCLACCFISSEISGMSDKPLVSAEKYNPVPPTIIGVG